MGKHVNSRVLTVRLPIDLADRIDRDAAALAMTRNEFLLRRLRASFSDAPEGRKSAEKHRDAAPDTDAVEFV